MSRAREAVLRLVGTDCLDDWASFCGGLTEKAKTAAFAEAEPLWVLRMLNEEKLLVHPDVSHELRVSGGVPTDLQRRMIWASVLASLDGQDSKTRFAEIRRKIEKKYDNSWWFDVYKRVKPAYAARMRLEKQAGQIGPAVRSFAESSIIGADALISERQAALRMIPRV